RLGWRGLDRLDVHGGGRSRSQDRGARVVRVKICGVRSVEAAGWVRDAGADFAGLNFVPSSKRRIEVPLAQKIKAALGEGVVAVGVFMDQSAEEIEAVA